MPPAARKRDYALTGNYSTELEKSILVGRIKDEYEKGSCSYACYGEEVAPTTNQKHLQGYIRFRHCKTKTAVINLLPGFHITMCSRDNEACGSTIAHQNRMYCSKTREQDEEPNEVFVEFGELPMDNKHEEGGKRTREEWDKIKELAMEDKLDDIDSEIYIKYYQTLKKIAKDSQNLPQGLGEPCGVWYYGDTGTGKSHAARVDFPEAYLKLPNKWWDGYCGQEYVIIDDFDKKHEMLGYHLKIWSDQYAFPCETKGGYGNIRPKKIVVTSNYHPKDIWSDFQTLGPLMRRFRITRFGNLSVQNPVVQDEEVREAYVAVSGFVPPPVIRRPYDEESLLGVVIDRDARRLEVVDGLEEDSARMGDQENFSHWLNNL